MAFIAAVVLLIACAGSEKKQIAKAGRGGFPEPWPYLLFFGAVALVLHG